MKQHTKTKTKIEANSFKSNNFSYRKVGRAITEWGTIEKENDQFDRSSKIISHFGAPVIFSYK